MSLDPTLAREITDTVALATGKTVSIITAHQLAGGASMETHSIDLRIGDSTEAFVLRRDMATPMISTALDRAREFSLLDLASRHGVACPRPRFLSRPDTPRQWFLMSRHPGESVGRRVVRDPSLALAREHLATDLGVALSKIHALPTGEVNLPTPAVERSPALEAIAQTRAAITALGFTRPSWIYFLRWLELRAPPCTGLSVVHGDFRIGNVLVTPDGLEAVIDWEFSHLGDRHEDLAWITLRDWRFGQDALTVGGVGHLEPFIAAYESQSDTTIDHRALVWWQLTGTVRWAITCHAQSARHLSGFDRSVELAVLGRKAAELELEALHLIDKWKPL